MASRIAIIGDGAMGALSTKLLSGKGPALCLWSAFPEHVDFMRAQRHSRYLPSLQLDEQVELTADADAALGGADIVISAVPCQFIRPVWQKLAEAFRPGTPICSVTKGIENRTLLRPTQVLSDVLFGSDAPRDDLAALSGPSIAQEVAMELPATVVAAANDPELARQVQQLFATPYFRVYTNSDLAGVELAGATKNVIAIAAGILDGMKAGDNAKAALLSRGLVEIMRLGLQLGGKRDTFFGLAGMGDLVTTCVSPFGRNRSFGEAIGKGSSVKEALAMTSGVVEGVATTASVLDLAQRQRVEMPITQAVYAVVFEGQPPRQAISALMSRPPKSEY
jgi:glycerol-3-phosphate dehydrogenase (NAD(P)+)